MIKTFLTAFTGFPFDLVFTCTFTECVTYITKHVSLTGIIMNFGIFFEMCSRVSRLNFTRESSFKGTPLGSHERLRRLRFSVELLGCEQNKTTRNEIYQRHRHLNLPLDQKLYLLPQAHDNFEINLI